MDLELEREEHQMTDKQKETIEEFEKLIKLRKNKAGEIKFDTCIVSTAQLEIVVNLIQTQQAEIEHQKEKRENQKKELSILNEKQKEFNKLRNTVNSYKGQFKRQQTEIEKKDNKLKDIENHIKAELRMIDKCFNEVGWAGKEQYDGMRAAYKCLLNIYFENQAKM